MKKYLILLVALAMVLGITSVAMALEGNLPVSDTIGVTATVADYAAITPSASDSVYTLTGAAGDDDTVSLSASIETNCDASVAMSATQLVNTASDVIDTTYAVTAPNALANGSFDPDPLATTYADSLSITGRGTYSYSVTGTATLGAISAQAAGSDYSATVTVTVSSI